MVAQANLTVSRLHHYCSVVMQLAFAAEIADAAADVAVVAVGEDAGTVAAAADAAAVAMTAVVMTVGIVAH